jgi:hypothetical protein
MLCRSRVIYRKKPCWHNSSTIEFACNPCKHYSQLCVVRALSKHDANDRYRVVIMHELHSIHRLCFPLVVGDSGLTDTHTHVRADASTPNSCAHIDPHLRKTSLLSRLLFKAPSVSDTIYPPQADGSTCTMITTGAHSPSGGGNRRLQFKKQRNRKQAHSIEQTDLIELARRRVNAHMGGGT